jgi:hypothetical protein
MNEEQRQSMIDAIEKSFAESGVDLYTGAPRLLHFIDSVRPHVEASCSRKTLDDYLAKANEMDVSEIMMHMALFAAAPTLFQQFATDCAVKVAESIPAPVGPPRKLTPEIEREIVKRLKKLYVDDGLPIGIAQGRVALQLSLGKRTVQTVWRKRHQLVAQPFQSMSDVWDFFRANNAEARIAGNR